MHPGWRKFGKSIISIADGALGEQCEELFQKMYLFLPLIFSNGVKRHVVEYDKLRFQPEIICNAVCEECLQNMYLFWPHIIWNGIKEDVVE